MVMERKAGDDETTCDLKQKNVFYREDGKRFNHHPRTLLSGVQYFFGSFPERVGTIIYNKDLEQMNVRTRKFTLVFFFLHPGSQVCAGMQGW